MSHELYSIIMEIIYIYIYNKLCQTLCVFSQMKATKHIIQDFHSVAWVMPQEWDFGALGCPGGQKKFFFSNMVMWHIKSMVMTSTTEGMLNFHSGSN